MRSSPSKENQGFKAREIKSSYEKNNLSIKDKQRNTGQYVLCTDPTTLCKHTRLGLNEDTCNIHYPCQVI